ncbi:ribosomal protein S18-alanine N-acetyltransferase [Solicola sp. PLA-1-18]|uniref:ribosomal protein S18-alanine N-acetyltransferase n=1 Tax=Solicola sp. PLA-1-18 TaxID=3380532 RepID=UPI003B7E61E8
MIAVELAGPLDTGSIAAVDQSCFGAEGWSEATVRAELDQVPDTRHVLVWIGRGEVAGWADLMVVGDVAEVMRLAVAPPGRGAGAGRALLRGLLDEARRRGCERVLLEVAADNEPALALYRSEGFAELSRRRAYYADGRDALVLALGLTG